MNLATSDQTVLQLNSRIGVASNGRPIANDGTAVFSNNSGALEILQGTQTRQVPIDQPAHDAVIDAGAHTIVYSLGTNIGPDCCAVYTYSLHMADVATGASALLASDGYAPSLTDDGSMVLYLSQSDGSPQAWVIYTDGSGNRKLTQDPVGITSAVISGDGSVAYAVTLGGRLLKISVITGEGQELIPRTPFIDAGQATAAGKLVSFTGAGLSDFAVTAAPPLPYTLDNIQVTLQGKPTRIFSVQPTAITVLTPPDVTPPPYPWVAPLQLDVASASPFAVPVTPILISDSGPGFLFSRGVPHAYMLAAHEDWSALVTGDNPARPGEVVHAYATGLAKTSPDVPYGAVAPSSEPFARVTADYHCFHQYAYGTPRKDDEVLFLGLAPGLVGIYQMDWRIPADSPDGALFISCGLLDAGYSFPINSFPGIVPVHQ